jgi:hypothetical protein
MTDYPELMIIPESQSVYLGEEPVYLDTAKLITKKTNTRFI